MGMKKARDVKLNVKPMFLTLYHEYSFEGPCRFGNGFQLEKEFDLMMAAEKFKSWYEALKQAMPEDVVNLLPPVEVQRDENFLTTDEMLEALAEDVEDVDLYFIGYASRPYDLALEFAQRYHKPCAIVQACCASAITSAEFLSRGLEFYPFEAWEDATEYMNVLRVRKVLRETKIMAATRMTSSVSVSSPDSIINPEDLTEKLGVRLRYLSIHELLDQMTYNDPMQNHNTPGRKGLNLTKEDEKKIESLTREFIDGSVECDMEYDMVKRSMEAYYTIKKFLNAYECNAFTAPCPDVCATRRLNNEKLTFCLTHSLLNEEGISSACEYDLCALLGLVILSNIAFKPAYMGNTFTSPVRNGVRAPLPKALFFNPDSVDKAMDDLSQLENVVLTFHSVPNRKWHGYEAENQPYAIRSFAHSGFGATIRYDFNRDAGQVITMTRIDPTCKKLFVAKGIVVGGIGYGDQNCSEGVFFQVKDSKDFYKKQAAIGNHVPLVYGDYVEQVKALGELVGLEVIEA